MSTETTWSALAVAGASDPTKRVNYTNGMILGVDDFVQEATYMLARDRWLAREALGYGTLSGLRVSYDPDALRDADNKRGPQIAVGPGVALTPSGYLVEVTRDQCAWLNDWLVANREHVVSPGDNERLSLYVVLRFRECLTDDQPVPGEPCRTADQVTAPSRVTDDFRLEIVLAPPDQVEENAVREFAAWLATIPIQDTGEDVDIVRERFAQGIPVFATAAAPAEGPLEFAPPDKWGTVPPPADVTIPPDEVTEFLRVAFRIWSTIIRPLTWGEGRTRSSTPPAVEDVLLAELQVLLREATDADGNAVFQVDQPDEALVLEGRRPHLLHLRMVQEWLLQQWREPATPGAPPPAGIPYGGSVKAETAFGIAARAGTSTNVSRADHTHGTPPDPIPEHKADASAHTLEGDVSGPTGATRIGQLQNQPVSAAAPTNGQVLTFSGGQWQPMSPGGGGATTLSGDASGATEATTVVGLQGRSVSNAPPAEGDVLVFTRDAWVPGVGPWVGHPVDRGEYQIVAAGLLQFDFGASDVQTVRPNDTQYNNLIPRTIDRGERIVGFSFDDYQMPELDDPKGHRYIVKVTPWYQMNDEVIGPEGYFVVGVREFREEVLLTVVPLAPNEELRGRIMIEVSRYFSIEPQ